MSIETYIEANQALTDTCRGLLAECRAYKRERDAATNLLDRVTYAVDRYFGSNEDTHAECLEQLDDVLRAAHRLLAQPRDPAPRSPDLWPAHDSVQVDEPQAQILELRGQLATANTLMAHLVAVVTDYYVSPEPGVPEEQLRRRLSGPHQRCERWLWSQEVPYPDWQWRRDQEAKESGGLTLTAIYEGGQQVGVRVERADERVLVQTSVPEGPSAPGCIFDGTSFTIEAVNGTWRYLLTDEGAVPGRRWARLIESPAVPS